MSSYSAGVGSTFVKAIDVGSNSVVRIIFVHSLLTRICVLLVHVIITLHFVLFYVSIRRVHYYYILPSFTVENLATCRRVFRGGGGGGPWGLDPPPRFFLCKFADGR